MFYKGWLSLTKLFGYVQFTVFVCISIFPSIKDSTRKVNWPFFCVQNKLPWLSKTGPTNRFVLKLPFRIIYHNICNLHCSVVILFCFFWRKDPGSLITCFRFPLYEHRAHRRYLWPWLMIVVEFYGWYLASHLFLYCRNSDVHSRFYSKQRRLLRSAVK